MAMFNTGRSMLHKVLINYWSNNVRWTIGRTRIQKASTGSFKPRANVQPMQVLSDEDKRRFDGVFPQVLSCLTRHDDHRLAPALEHFKSVLEYNVPNGHKRRGLLTLAAYKMLTSKQSEEQLMNACIMGWCAEMVQAFVIISDDISDNSVMRRGKPCWYQLENVGLQFAVFDIMTVENGVYKLLKTYFHEEPYYNNVMDLFHDVALRSAIGQSLDAWFSNQNQNFDRFIEEDYGTLGRNKSALYTIHLPLTAALHMVGHNDKGLLLGVEKICLQIGQLYQARNDYTDCFVDPNVTGKIGTDIEEGKCTWLIVNALKLVSDNERDQLRRCYGKKDPELINFVYNKYVELQLDRRFDEYEKNQYDAIAAAIGQMPPQFPSNVLYYCLDNLFNSPR